MFIFGLNIAIYFSCEVNVKSVILRLFRVLVIIFSIINLYTITGQAANRCESIFGEKMKVMDIHLRDFESDDFIKIKEIHRLTMKAFVESRWGWDSDKQVVFLKSNLDKYASQVILYNKTIIGILMLDVSESKIVISNLLIDPAFQGRGVGSNILSSVIDKYTDDKKSIELSVFKENKAFGLYKRLGFRVVKEESDKYFMKLK